MILTALILAASLGPVRLCLTQELECKHVGPCFLSTLWIGDLEGVSYGLDHSCDRKGHKIVLSTRPAGTQADWQEIDSMSLDFDEKEFAIYAVGQCRIQGQIDPEIFAMVRPERRAYLRAVKAWRADRKQGKLVLIPARGVDCEQELCDD